MSKPTYRCGKSKAARIRQIIIYVNHHDLDGTLDRYTLAVIQELRKKLTERELQCLTGYYIQQTALAELGPKLGINPSTVCRSIQRGQEKLWQVIDLADQISPFRLPESMQLGKDAVKAEKDCEVSAKMQNCSKTSSFGLQEC